MHFFDEISNVSYGASVSEDIFGVIRNKDFSFRVETFPEVVVMGTVKENMSLVFDDWLSAR